MKKPSALVKFLNLHVIGQDEAKKTSSRPPTEPANSIYSQYSDLFKNEGVELAVEPAVFEQIAELAVEYKTGARSLRGCSRS